MFEHVGLIVDAPVRIGTAGGFSRSVCVVPARALRGYAIAPRPDPSHYPIETPANPDRTVSGCRHFRQVQPAPPEKRKERGRKERRQRLSIARHGTTEHITHTQTAAAVAAEEEHRMSSAIIARTLS